MNETNKKIYFAADFHFGHRNVIEYCKRPFNNVSEMNSQLIKNFNNTVEHDAITYILGDFSFLNTESTKQILKAMKGFKILVKGNHDPKPNSYYRKLGFSEVYDKPILFRNKFILSHEPLNKEIYENSSFINFYGHLHNNATNKDYNRFCVSIEMIDYKPISLQNIEEHFRNYCVIKNPYFVSKVDE